MEKTTTQTKKEEVTQWFLDYGDELYIWAYHKTSDNIIAEDFVQETFLSAIQSYDNFLGKSNPKTWLFSILNNKIIDYYRLSARSIIKKELNKEDLSFLSGNSQFDKNNNWKVNGFEQSWEEDGNLLDSPAFNNIMSSCMEQLPEKWKIAVSGKYLIGKKSAEICKELDITPSNYWQILHRSKLFLKKCIEGHWLKNEKS